ncbi:FecR protein [compost metagenome]
MPAKMLASQPTPARAKPWFMLLLALLVALSPALPTHAEEVIARLLQLQGTVEVRRKGDSDWSPAIEGRALNPGDTIRTLGRSQATVLRPDGTTLELYPLSEATVEDEKAVMLWLGKIWSQFQKAIGSPQSIRTPSSVALIRGTVLTVEAESSGASHVAVVEGLVEVVDRRGDRKELVGAGFAVRADREGRLQRMERARPDTLDEGRGFMDRLERDRHLRQRDEAPGPAPADRAPRNDDRAPRRNTPPGREGLQERIDRPRPAGEPRLEQKLRLEERIEREGGERLERLIDRTQRDERREIVEQRREERREERLEERAQQESEQSNSSQRDRVLERLRERLRRGR